MRSMTGFGAGEAPLASSTSADRGKLVVELRAVNHRYLDVRARVPRELSNLLPHVENTARERLKRGRFEISVRVEGVALGAVVLDRERARSVVAALRELRDELAPGSDVPLSVLAGIPDLFVPSLDRESEAVRVAFDAAFDAGVTALDEMRLREGSSLGEDLRRRLETVRSLAQRVAVRAPELIEGQRRRLKERTDRLRLGSDFEIDGGRLEQEIALFAERIDICEELTRLESHCAHFESLVVSPDAVGRRLDFLLQEMAREANTVGAKSPDAPIAHLVVELKAEIERMREQVQNIQ